MTKPRRAKTGFTLVELVIAFLILMTIGSAVLIAIKSSSQESKFINEQFSASLLSRKVVEDVMSEVEINPWAAESMIFSQAKMVDGELHFFSNLEDTSQPYFQLEYGEGNINNNQQPLYSLLESFRISLSTDLTDSQISSAKINLNWKSAISKGRLKTDFHFPNYTQQKIIDFPFESPPEELEKYICGYLYATQTQPISTLLNNPTIGGHAKTIEALGQIGLMSSRFFASDLYTDTVEELKKLEQEKETLLAAHFIDTNKLDTCLSKLVEKRYSLAKTSFQIFVFIEPFFKTLKQNYNQASLGIHYQETILLKTVMQNVKKLGDFFTLSIWLTITDLQNYFNPQISDKLSSLKMFKTSMKMINLARIMSISSIYKKLGKNGKADYLKLLKHLAAGFKGRFPALERLIAQEISLQNNPEKAFSSNQSLNSVYEYLKPGGKFDAVLQFIKEKNLL